MAVNGDRGWLVALPTSKDNKALKTTYIIQSIALSLNFGTQEAKTFEGYDASEVRAARYKQAPLLMPTPSYLLQF